MFRSNNENPVEKNHGNNHELLKAQINQGWETSRQNAVIRRLNGGDDLQAIMESFPELEKHFTELDTIDCSDGRVLQGRKMGIAGSGLLLPSEERADFIARFKGKIKMVTTHDNCGAAALRFNSLSPKEIPAGIKTADEYGTYLGKELASGLGAEHKYLDRQEMANEYHNETALLLDSTGQFDSTNLAGFPAHFVCTGAGLGFSERYMKSETNTLVRIALGDHGFGNRFDSANPFYVIVSADSQEELDRWRSVAKEAVAEFGDRIVINGFIRPEKK